VPASCASCRYFHNAAAEVESLLPAIRALGSAHGSVRDEDGVCERHQRYLRAGCCCPQHQPVARVG
jgi:hypothetical protein